MTEVAIRDAATVILVRDPETSPSVLMGQRGASAAFMPDKFVFPGGRVDDDDQDIPMAGNLSPDCDRRLRANSETDPMVLVATAIRELWEETGQVLGQQGDWAEPPKNWQGFAASGLVPQPEPLCFFFRALTPPGRPRRFDARFFLADARHLASDPDHFAPAEAELSHLGWVPLAEVRQLNLPFITRIVLAELERHLPRTDPPDQVPFVRNDDVGSRVIWS